MAKRKATYGAYRGHGRRRAPAPAPFQAWGMALAFMALLLAAVGAWPGVGFVIAVLIFYLLAIRLTRCRVETRQGSPCRWLVRGLVGTCDWHRGLKRGLPRLLQVPRSALPRFMWPRPDVIVAATSAPDPQPRASAATVEATAPGAARPGYDWVMLGLEVLSALVAVVSFAHQMVRG